jgi:hypothetical protein
MKKKRVKKTTAQNGSLEKQEGFAVRALQFVAFMLLAVAALADLGTLMIQKLFVFKRKAL